jgi:chromosome segregation protein
LLTEIEPRRRSLKRQARKAQRKGEVRQELKVLQKEYFNHLWNKIKAQYEKIREKVDQFSAEEKEIEDRINKIKAKLDKSEEDIDYRGEDEKREALNDLVNQKNDIKEKLAVTSGRLKVEEERDYSTDLVEVKRRKESVEEEMKSCKEKVAILKKEKTEILRALDGDKSRLAEVSREVSDLEDRLKSMQTRSASWEIEDIQNDLEIIYHKQGVFLGELEACDDVKDLEELKQKASEFQSEFEAVMEKVEEIAGGSEFSRNEFEEVQNKINDLIKARKDLEGEVNRNSVESAVKDAKINSLVELIAAKEKELKKIDDQLGVAGRGGGKENLAVAQLLSEQRDWQRKLAGVESEIERVEKELLGERKKAQERRKEIFKSEKAYREKQEELNRIRNLKNEREISRTKIEGEREILIDEIKDNTREEEFDELIAEFESSPVKVSVSREGELKDKISRLRNQLLRIGEIDPEVVKEYEECEKRYDFLSKQKEDLEAALESLRKVIAELDQTINNKFEAAFENINSQFQKYFKVLFGGGRARLVRREQVVSQPAEGMEENESSVEGSDQPREESIDIKATPPGKKLRELNMLSGGEKALTSIALLFAIITNNPSPFIVLDEVDAALDESNTSRYADIIFSLAKKSQFIIITHNRETMRRAELMYGVTMNEEGISKLLSVKLGDLPSE